MDSKQVLTIEHRKEVGPGCVFCLFSIVEEDIDSLMVLLKKKKTVQVKSWISTWTANV